LLGVLYKRKIRKAIGFLKKEQPIFYGCILEKNAAVQPDSGVGFAGKITGVWRSA